MATVTFVGGAVYYQHGSIVTDKKQKNHGAAPVVFMKMANNVRRYEK